MKINHLIRRANSAFRYLLKLPPPLVSAKLIDRDYLIRSQTIRDVADKDDAWLLACSYEAKRIFDIGANIGQSAFLELYPASVEHVLLLDPNPLALTIAAENLILNHLVHRVNFVCAFVGEKPDEIVDFYTILYGAAGSIYPTHAATAAKHNLHYQVPTTTIDKLTDNFGIPDFIKIDVEGAEVAVLEGAKDCLRHKATRILVEMHSSQESPILENTRRLMAICEETGYHAWYLSRNVPLSDPQQLADRGRCHLLLQPREWDWPKKIISIKQNALLDEALKNHLSTVSM